MFIFEPMNNKVRLQLVCFGTCLSMICLGQESSLHKQIGRILTYDTEHNYAKTPGFIVGVFDGSSVNYELFGESLDSVAFDPVMTVFDLGNISKTVLLKTYKKLVDKDMIDGEMHINDCLDLKYKNPRFAEVTLSDLTQFKHVFPELNADYLEENMTAKLARDHLLMLYPKFVKEDIGDIRRYSDANLGYLELFIEMCIQDDFQNLLDKTLNTDLNTNFIASDYENRNNLTTTGLSKGGIKGKGREWQTFGGSLGLKGSAHDLLNLAQLVSKDFKPYLRNLDSLDAVLPETWNPRVRAYGGMFLIDVNNNTRVLATHGTSKYHSAFMAVNPATHTGVVILANSAIGTNDLGMLILRMINNNWKRKLTN